jgi:hypothetical protein
MATITRRLQWLFPVEREVYQTWRTFFINEKPACIRCGAPVGCREVGLATRRRGTKWIDKQAHHIHRRCVPTAEFERAGLPARRARSA